MMRSLMLLLLCVSLSIREGTGEDSGQDLASEYDTLAPNSLAGALEEMLDYNQDKGIRLQRRVGQLPWCDVGERCAMKLGSRVGKLCDCLRGASCNSFLLRCY
ncbi:cocaine- and amphetamine-regulated transcript protein-like [Xenopus laevis]|uniref:Cocaine- and amphetamine-regulated transcript protein-like n=1 Tax=Xenopus laevis TaxID=8355 RepID=A0A8J1LIR6_XENLA|nr:cocaine- and amphetamine-regulated transcript protein-like [Xenopus laevis]